MPKRLRPRITFANVVSCLALFVAIGGSAYAAKQLPKNSVGSPQIKKNAVKTGDIARNAVKVGKLAKEAVKAGKLAKNAVPTNRLRDNAVTGDKVNESTLGTVPSAQTSNSIVPPEGWHEIGAPGEPGFENSWVNVPPSGLSFETAAFYMDHEGIVHLKGLVKGGSTSVIFHLPPGYRPANGRVLARIALCGEGACTDPVGLMFIAGSGISVPGFEGAVVGPGTPGSTTSLEGISFRAES